ncbi:Sec-independent protein translocase protein TatB [Desulfovibrio gilichinskyi]|uniref:Sec-independent protein translocase protein TatB n=1 Tax=Desulfovibrio gilichinskyi TaxID=1519643 RepID=A0A1X7ERN2_9BACT|nr:Sec-independent protein translocase protein TatB [Desulfovibrio gilichinskyi]SMF38835.1 sec-independent protein translocase protein TatB [Desulfovibrio gilichinskyi]
MFGIGTTELIVILVVALIIIGPQKLPELIKNLGRGLSEVKKMSHDVKSTLDAEVAAADNERQAKEDRAKEEARRKAEVEAMDKAREAEAAKAKAETLKPEENSGPVEEEVIVEAAADSEAEGKKA